MRNAYYARAKNVKLKMQNHSVKFKIGSVAVGARGRPPKAEKVEQRNPDEIA